MPAMLGTLRVRLFLSFAVVVLVTLASAGVAFYSRLGGYRDELTASTLRQVVLPVYFGLTLPGPNRVTAAEISAYLRAQAEHTDIIVLLLDKQGHVLRDYTPSGAYADETFPTPPAIEPPRFRELREFEHTTEDGQQLLYVVVPLPARMRPMSTTPGGASHLVVAIPKDSTGAIVGDLRPRLLIAAIAGGGAAVVVALLLAGSLLGPLHRLTRSVRAIARGDYRTRVPASGPREVRDLAADVNLMAGAVEQSQQALRDFLANVSHELKTPLTSIRGFSQAMLDGTLSDDEGRERAARVIESESRRLLHLVEELLDLSRVQGRQSAMAQAPVSVRELLDHVADVFAIRSQETGVELRVERPDLVVLGDYDRLEQVLGNLLDNAFRHTPSGGRIEVAARPLDGIVEFAVRDTGEGIPPDEIDRVFDRFYRSSMTTSGAGVGLGLAIAREIVRAHGGDIRVESPPGGGARFVFTVPAAPAPAAQPAIQRPARLFARRP